MNPRTPSGNCWNYYNLRSITSKRKQPELCSYQDKISTVKVSNFNDNMKSQENLLSCSTSKPVKRWKETSIFDSKGDFLNDMKSQEELLNYSPSNLVKRGKETKIVDSKGNFLNEDMVAFKKKIEENLLNKAVQCDLCKELSKEEPKGKVKKKLKKMSEAQYKCKKCENWFSTGQGLGGHVAMIHSKKYERFIKSVCDKFVVEKFKDLNIHI